MRENGLSTYRSMAAAVFWITLLSVASKILGFGREMALGAVFGISYETDAYFVAMSIPTVIFSSIFVPLQTTTIPVYTRYLQKGKAEAQGLAGSLFYSIVILSLFSAFLGFVFASPMVRLLAPRFTGETSALTVELARMMMPAVPFVALAPVVTALLHSHRSFLLPAAAGFPFNLILIFAILGFGPHYGITAVAAALVIALASQLLMQLPGLFQMDIIKWSFRDFDYEGLKNILILTVPVLIGLVGNDINLLVDRILASGLPEGSIAALTFASRLNSMPHALFGVTLLTVFFPQLSRLAVNNSIVEFKYCLERAAGAIIFLLVPSVAGFALLRTPIVKILFQRDAFDAHATAMTAVALLFYSLGLVAWALNGLLSRAFYSFHDTRTPVIVTFFTVTINILLNLILIRYMAHAGLALATSIATNIGLLVSFLLFSKKIGALDIPALIRDTLKIVSASLIMGLFVWLFNTQTARMWLLLSEAKQALLLLFTISGGVAIYIGCCYLFRVKEMHYFKDLLIKKICEYRDRRFEE